MSAGRILVINPNSNPEVTAGMDEALAPLRLAGGPLIECMTLAEGPFGIETDAHVAAVVAPLVRTVSAEPADAFVIACYSDPGLAACREATARPVIGIQEAAIATALTRGARFGVIALSESSIARQRSYAVRLGIAENRRAGARPLGLSVAAAEGAAAFPTIALVARQLVEADGADVLILGCAGMARHRRPLEQALGLPVIDPVQAAGAAALGAVLLASG